MDIGKIYNVAKTFICEIPTVFISWRATAEAARRGLCRLGTCSSLTFCTLVVETAHHFFCMSFVHEYSFKVLISFFPLFFRESRVVKNEMQLNGEACVPGGNARVWCSKPREANLMQPRILPHCASAPGARGASSRPCAAASDSPCG